MPASHASTWYIRHLDLFRRLSDQELDELVGGLHVRRLSAGEPIIGPNSQPESAFVVKLGTVRLFHRADGRDITVDHLGRGRLFGVSGRFGASAGLLLAEAENTVEVCTAETRQFLEVVSGWPQVMVELAVRLGVRILETEEKLGRMATSGAKARLAGVLHRMVVERGGDDGSLGERRLVRLPLTHAEIARQIGASRETVTRMLASLEQEGYIRRQGKQVTIPDMAKLVDDFELPATR
jgi:CRP-like cAMP-binding protein